MRENVTLKHEFVEFMPDFLEERTLYVSMKYATVIHKCCCGCGNKVVTPLTPTDWKLTYDGRRISLYPSIGNWGFPCTSHYWITGSKVRWSTTWTRDEIEAGRERERDEKGRYFRKSGSSTDESVGSVDIGDVSAAAEKRGFWKRLFGLLHQ